MVMSRKELGDLTATKLRELAMRQYPEIQGVSGMEKEQIIEAIIAEEVRRGLRPKEEGKAVRPSEASALKARIRSLKAERGKALLDKNADLLRRAREEIKRNKRKLRRLHRAAVVAKA